MTRISLSARSSFLSLLFTVVVSLAAILSLSLVRGPELVAFIWIPTGLAVYAFQRHGRGIWPLAFLGIGLGYLLVFYWRLPMEFTNADAAAIWGLAALATILPVSIFGQLEGYVTKAQAKRASVLNIALLLGSVFVLAGIASILQVGVLFATGLIQTDALFAHGVTYLIGHSLGGTLFAPFIVGRLLEDTRAVDTERLPAKNIALVFVIVLAIMGGTVFAWKSTSDSVSDRNAARFKALVVDSEKALMHRMESYEDALLGGSGFFYGSSVISRADWRHYVDALDVANRYPGINGIGFITRVAASDIENFIWRQRIDGAPDMTIHPDVDNNTYYVINYIEPIKLNLLALGLNIAFEAKRKAAADQAMETGKSTVTNRILLVQDAEQTPSFLLLYPVYNNNAADLTVEQRRANLVGWVYAPFIGKNFLRNLTASQGQTLALEIYDGTQEDADNLIFSEADTNHTEMSARPSYTASRTIDIMQRQWTLIWKSTLSFDESASSSQPQIVLAGGAIVASLVGLFLMTLTRHSIGIEREVQRKTHEIVEAGRKLQAVLDTVVDGIVSISAKGIITAFNPSAERIFGYSAVEVIGKNVNVLMPEPYHSAHDGYLTNYLTTGEQKIIGIGRSVKARRKDGSIFPMELGVSRMSVDDEMGFVGSIRDITEREAAEKALEVSEQIFRQTMEQASIGMALVSPFGAWVRVNKAVCDLLGYEEEELLNTDFRTTSHPDDLEADLAQMAKLISGAAESYEMEKRFIAKQRGVIWVNLNVSLVRKADGAPDYFIKQMVDITERKEMDRMKSEFISIVSHELRTPITSIRGSLGLIVGAFSKDLSEKVLGLVTIAHKNSERLIMLVNDILDMDKLDSGQMVFEIKREQVSRLIQQALEANISYSENYDVLLRGEEVDTKLAIDVDPFRFSQVLANFISNAVKFSPGGGVVSVFATAIGDKVRIGVEDSGIGISDEFRNRIFTKFAQADSSSTRQKGGTGLGLLISKQLVEQMGGEIGFDSVPGNGATFWVEFPVQPHLKDTDPKAKNKETQVEATT